MKRFIFQATTTENHIDEVNSLLSNSDLSRAIISTAFMSASGLSLIEDSVKKSADCLEIFVGIRNGVTTAQALSEALALGCKLYIVDTGSRTRIFHPKMYFRKGVDEAQIIIGSANLTIGGLNSNIEASLMETLDFSDIDDASFAQRVTDRFDELIANYPQNVIQITKEKQIAELLNSGRVVDEANEKIPLVVGISDSRGVDDIPKMALLTKMLYGAVAQHAKNGNASAKVLKTHAGKPIRSSAGGLELLWKSTPLTRRDLGIPLKSTTMQTGSMLWKKGDNEIDSQTYFREQVFNELEWIPNKRTEGKELAEAVFQLVIRGIDYGLHNLTVTHDTRTDTSSFRQMQPMSAVRWGEVRPLIANSDLLERIMTLYRDPDDKGVFVIDID